jgi:hypothetical protein
MKEIEEGCFNVAPARETKLIILQIHGKYKSYHPGHLVANSCPWFAKRKMGA